MQQINAELEALDAEIKQRESAREAARREEEAAAEAAHEAEVTKRLRDASGPAGDVEDAYLKAAEELRRREGR